MARCLIFTGTAVLLGMCGLAAVGNEGEPAVEPVGIVVDKTNGVERTVGGGAASGRPARITSQSTYYDRKEGIGVFSGKVHLDDERYQLHADKVYVFMEGTNELRRVVAIGNVAMTNELRSARAAKASYYRQSGLVVLYGDGERGIATEVRDESRGSAQVVRGQKIKFWIDSEQVEVIEAELEAPTSGLKDVKGILGK